MKVIFFPWQCCMFQGCLPNAGNQWGAFAAGLASPIEEAGPHEILTKWIREFQGPPKGGVSNGGGFPIWTCPSFFVLFCPFGTFPGIFLICSGMVRGFSRFVLFLFLGLLRAPTRNSPERVRDTIWTCPEKSGKHPGLETPRFSFSQEFSALRGDIYVKDAFRESAHRAFVIVLWSRQFLRLWNAFKYSGFEASKLNSTKIREKWKGNN